MIEGEIIKWHKQKLKENGLNKTNLKSQMRMKLKKNSIFMSYFK